MNKNYTPGNWKESVNMGADPIVVTEDEFICQVAPGNHTNAQLISAAPDLVEALIDSAKQRSYDAYAKDFGGRQASQFPEDAVVEWKNFLTDMERTALTKAGVLTK